MYVCAFSILIIELKVYVWEVKGERSHMTVALHCNWRLWMGGNKPKIYCGCKGIFHKH